MTPEVSEAPVSALALYRTLVGVGVLCAVLIVVVYELTKPVIAQKRAEALEQAIFQVLPGAKTSKSFELAEDGTFRTAQGARSLRPRVHTGFDDQGRVVGVAIEAQGLGYQDVIELLYGYAPERQAIVGMVVLQSRETPGLGDKIETDPQFRANFEALDVSLDDSGEKLRNEIVSVKHGDKTAPHQIDAITGATVSSKAVAKILRESTAQWVPRLAAHRTEIE